MSLDKKSLLEFVKLIDSELEGPVDIIAVGGTAMTLLDMKRSTIDVDFDFPADEGLASFKKAMKAITPGFRVDIFLGSQIFSQKLPDDYKNMTISIRVGGLAKLKLFALHPVDIVLSKIGRLSDRDVEDIRTCIQKYGLSGARIRKRGNAVEEAGNENVYRENLEFVLKNFFGKNRRKGPDE